VFLSEIKFTRKKDNNNNKKTIIFENRSPVVKASFGT
jgi:hypothetical protein